MQNVSLGQTPQRDAERDAVHVGVYPAVAAEQLQPGQVVGLGPAGATPNLPRFGVVDPFVSGPIAKGERFWLLLCPGVAQSLRHDWTHPTVEALESGEPASVVPGAPTPEPSQWTEEDEAEHDAWCRRSCPWEPVSEDVDDEFCSSPGCGDSIENEEPDE